MATATADMDLSVYLEKGPTDLQTRFGDWIVGTVGYDPSRAKTKDEAFREGVRLATALRMPFQRSDENQEILVSRREERESGTAEKRTPSKKASAVAPPAKKASKKAAAKVEPEEPEEQPAKATKKTAAKAAKSTVAAAPRNKRRPAAPDPDGDEAPF